MRKLRMRIAAVMSKKQQIKTAKLIMIWDEIKHFIVVKMTILGRVKKNTYKTIEKTSTPKNLIQK